MGRNKSTWTQPVKMALLAYVVYCHYKGLSVKETAAPHITQIVGHPMTPSAIEAQMARLGCQLRVSSRLLNQRGVKAINVRYLSDKEKKLLDGRLRELFGPELPPTLFAKLGHTDEGSKDYDHITKGDQQLDITRENANSDVEPILDRTLNFIDPTPTLPSLTEGLESANVQSPTTDSRCELEMTRLKHELSRVVEKSSGLSTYHKQLESKILAAEQQITLLNNDLEIANVVIFKKQRDLDVTKRSLALKQDRHGLSLLEQQSRGHQDENIKRVQELYDVLLSSMDLPRDGNAIGTPISPRFLAQQYLDCRHSLTKVLSCGNLWPQSAVKTTSVAPGFLSFLRKLFGASKHVPTHDISEALCTIPPEYLRSVLKAYAMDSLCEKVFQGSDYHDFDKTHCRLLERYRLLIGATTGGLKALRSLDLGATKSLLSDGNGLFRHKLVQQEARKLNEQLQQELSPFYVDELAERPSAIGSSSFGDCAAKLIQLKLELLVSDKRYEFRFVEAGSRFDADTMDAVDKAGNLRSVTCDAEVKLCVAPGMVEYDIETPEADMEFSAVLVSSKTFHSGETSPKSNLITITKAVVLLDIAELD